MNLGQSLLTSRPYRHYQHSVLDFSFTSLALRIYFRIYLDAVRCRSSTVIGVLLGGLFACVILNLALQLALVVVRGTQNCPRNQVKGYEFRDAILLLL